MLLLLTDLRVIRTRIDTGDFLYQKAALKTRDIPTLTNRHLLFNNSDFNPPLSAIDKTPNVYAGSRALLLLFP